MFTLQHICLIIFWMLFGLFHSLFAASRFKNKMQLILKQHYKFYRPLYSLFSAITLTLVVWYHFHISSSFIWKSSLAEIYIAVVLAIAGLVVMYISGSKYFLQITGIDVFIKRSSSNTLQQKGLHKFVRHPLYSGTLLFVWALFFWHPFLNNLISCICITLYVRTGIYFEERKLVNDFGDTYKKYKAKTPMLIPNLL